MRKELSPLLDLYRAARTMRPEAFPEHALAWLCHRLPFDQGFFVTSFNGATWVDAHFYKVPNPRALMDSHAAVRHLDEPSARMLQNPSEVHRAGYDHPEIAGARFEPFRRHLERFDAKDSLMVAIPSLRDEVQTVLVVVRGKASRPFSSRLCRLYQLLAPHVCEALQVNRACYLPHRSGVGGGDRAVAILSPDGMLKATSPDFAYLLWRDTPARSAYLPETMLEKVRRGRACPLPLGKHTLYAEAHSDGWLLRVRESGPLDRLSRREREVAVRFARGESYKMVAKNFNVAPVTIRNQLQNAYAKLGVSSREELQRVLREYAEDHLDTKIQ